MPTNLKESLESSFPNDEAALGALAVVPLGVNLSGRTRGQLDSLCLPFQLQ